VRCSMRLARLSLYSNCRRPARAIDSKLTAMGKDERAISVSGCVRRVTDRALGKTVTYTRLDRRCFTCPTRAQRHLRRLLRSPGLGDFHASAKQNRVGPVLRESNTSRAKLTKAGS
jgi:hypothetical protein